MLAMLPGIARDSREPWLIGGCDQYKHISAFHAGDYITSGIVYVDGGSFFFKLPEMF